MSKEKAERIQVARESLEQALRDYLSVARDGAYLTDYVVGIAGVAASAAGPAVEYQWVMSASPLHSIRGLNLGLTEAIDSVWPKSNVRR